MNVPCMSGTVTYSACTRSSALFVVVDFHSPHSERWSMAKSKDLRASGLSADPILMRHPRCGMYFILVVPSKGFRDSLSTSEGYVAIRFVIIARMLTDCC